ncbi:MAG: glycoside hydrolase family 3 C-terminal domain-containing protein [Bacteroidales bacterium]|nr:glycoside hydrolase family 3 C-terminal domain-containing protein [Bacteroidales bacterium]
MLTFILAAALAVSGPVLRPDNIPEIVSLLTLEEKAAILVGCGSSAFDGIGRNDIGVKGSAGATHAIPRLGIPSIVFADGPAGLRIDPTRPGTDKTFYCTGFPIGTMLASAWNPELVQEVGEAMGNEVLEYGVDVLLGPGANIHRNPLCGRNFEYFSEDPVLAGETAAAYINGIESNGVGACIKHFAANNQELNRLHNDARLSQRALREIYLKVFEIAVRKSQPWTLMTSYNYINGTHASEAPWLLTDILRGDWGFEGTVMTDWGGGYDTAAQIHAGNELIQSGSDARYNALIEAVRSGRLAMADVDRSVTRALELIVKCPAYRGYKHSDAPDLEAHAAVCRKAADEGMVLLKNDGALPAGPSGVTALLGVTSYAFIAGGTGSGDVHRPYVIDLQQGLSDGGFTLDKGLDEFYSAYMQDERWRCKMIDGNNSWVIDRERPVEALPADLIRQAAESADRAFVTFGRVFGEGKDRDLHYSYMLQDRELDLLRETSRAFHARGKKVTVILNIGGVVDVRSWEDLADAILICWQPGEEGGHSLADVLSGAVNPSGRLPMTISDAYEHEPSAPNFPRIYADKPFNYSFYRRLEGNKKDYTVKDIDYTDYEEGIWVGYRYFQTKAPGHVAYPFGYGLSYTSFKWSGLKVAAADGGYRVCVTVRNTGKVAGKDVVQLYVKAPGRDMEKPARELKAFAKTPLLQPGESCTVEMFVSVESLASWDEKSSSWSVEKGRYRFIAARNAADRGLRRRIRFQ